MKNIPCWLYISICHALEGEIYPAIRAIAVKYTRTRELFIRYYFDREVTEDDIDRINTIMTYIESYIPPREDVRYIDYECIYAKDKLSDLDVLDHMIYARREDDC